MFIFKKIFSYDKNTATKENKENKENLTKKDKDNKKKDDYTDDPYFFT